MADITNESTADETATPRDPVPADREKVVEVRRGGFAGAIVGGLFAGAVGYGLAFFQFGPGDEVVDTTGPDNAAAIAELQAAVEELAEGPDFAPLQQAVDSASAGASEASERVDALQDELGDTLAQINANIAALDERLTDVEQRPQADGSLSSAAVEAYEREIAALREETAATVSALEERVATAEGNVESLSGQVQNELVALQEQAETVEAQSAAAADAAAARAAAEDVASALRNGAPYAEPLAELQATEAGADVPQVIAENAEEGVTSLSELQASYADAARAALAAARAAGEDATAEGTGGFFRRQFNVRSVEPREGDDPDAVLSRAEAALREGRVAEALAELDALPAPALEAMADWRTAAARRVEALAALDDLTQSLNTN
ncbi:hypothetical protein OG2516_11666 [Oceanicola granulosus HTCC2516]|uniref:Mitochondrial inner membrane protein n=1 Tax=Oceanicola granulosus (strain ATCC BAA-861 / DSM 15982 / KCTC 12143 / HTCC2516) TaxID=314256 RepID=Q2CJM0_OCEGH|nr:hypothetical protein [Oceanicola granulosus]EAR53119.1 hypothetical protein OG2516_11666 [Oceanicola granulosus HTCC2516]